MRALLAFLIVGVASCTSTPPNPWEGITVEISPAASPVDCGSFPYPTKVEGESIVYDNSGANDLEAYRVCSEANAAIVSEHAQQIMQLKIARKALVDAGNSQRNIADMRLQMLEDERKHHFFKSIGYWVVIAGMGAAL